MAYTTKEPPPDSGDLIEPPERLRRPIEAPERPDLDFQAILSRMTPTERISASRHGGFTRRERTIWAARFPEEVPLRNGEFEWIASNLE
jgi:hypothetical protein